MIYRCRCYVTATWQNVEATSPIEAAAIFHAELPTIFCQRLVWPHDGDDLLFLLVDVEGYFEGLLSRLRVPRKLAGRTSREPWADHREEVARAIFWLGTLDELVDTWPEWGDVDREVTRNMSQRTEAFYLAPATPAAR